MLEARKQFSLVSLGERSAVCWLPAADLVVCRLLAVGSGQRGSLEEYRRGQQGWQVATEVMYGARGAVTFP